MGIFSSIVNAIFGSKAAEASPAASGGSAAPAAGSAPAASSAPTPISKAEVEAIIAKIEADRIVPPSEREAPAS